jgi:Tfp pilus assembly protein PilF
MSDEDVVRRAAELWQEGCRLQMAGELERAIAAYRRSIEVRPTAEAHTYLGWTYSFQGKLDEATAECMRAIEIDPEFGNPYNDIGSYLIALGRLKEAVPWLRKAMGAPRYEPRHYPHVNLARVYAKLGQIDAAIAQLRVALAIAPQYRPARAELHRLLGLLN